MRSNSVNATPLFHISLFFARKSVFFKISVVLLYSTRVGLVIRTSKSGIFEQKNYSTPGNYSTHFNVKQHAADYFYRLNVLSFHKMASFTLY